MASRWYFGKLNRIEASGHLIGPENGEGAFLVRMSEKDDVGYVLSGTYVLILHYFVCVTRKFYKVR